MKKNIRFLIFVLIFAAVIVTACGGGASEQKSEVPAEYAGKTNPVAGDANALAAGKVIYDVTCSSCHGVSGKGDGPAGQALTPPASDLTKAVASTSEDYLYYRVAEGGSMDPYNSSMPAHKSSLSEDEIWQVVTYITSLK